MGWCGTASQLTPHTLHNHQRPTTNSIFSLCTEHCDGCVPARPAPTPPVPPPSPGASSDLSPRDVTRDPYQTNKKRSILRSQLTRLRTITALPQYATATQAVGELRLDLIQRSGNPALLPLDRPHSRRSRRITTSPSPMQGRKLVHHVGMSKPTRLDAGPFNKPPPNGGDGRSGRSAHHQLSW